MADVFRWSIRFSSVSEATPQVWGKIYKTGLKTATCTSTFLSPQIHQNIPSVDPSPEAWWYLRARGLTNPESQRSGSVPAQSWLTGSASGHGRPTEGVTKVRRWPSCRIYIIYHLSTCWHLLSQLEVLHQVLFTLSQLKYCLEEEFSTEEEKLISKKWPFIVTKKQTYCQKKSKTFHYFDSHLLSFNLPWAERLRRSQPDVERLAPKFTVAPLAGGSRSRANPRRSHGRARAGDRCRDHTRLCAGGRWRWRRRRRRRRRRSYLRLIHVPETDGALQKQDKFKMHLVVSD